MSWGWRNRAYSPGTSHLAWFSQWCPGYKGSCSRSDGIIPSARPSLLLMLHLQSSVSLQHVWPHHGAAAIHALETDWGCGSVRTLANEKVCWMNMDGMALPAGFLPILRRNWSWCDIYNPSSFPHSGSFLYSIRFTPIYLSRVKFTAKRPAPLTSWTFFINPWFCFPAQACVASEMLLFNSCQSNIPSSKQFERWTTLHLCYSRR